MSHEISEKILSWKFNNKLFICDPLKFWQLKSSILHSELNQNRIHLVNNRKTHLNFHRHLCGDYSDIIHKHMPTKILLLTSHVCWWKWIANKNRESSLKSSFILLWDIIKCPQSKPEQWIAGGKLMELSKANEPQKCNKKRNEGKINFRLAPFHFSALTENYIRWHSDN